MKTFACKFRLIFVSFVLGALFLSGCSNTDEAKNVREYNNKIVAIQQEMLERGAEVTQVLNGQTLDLQKALTEFQKMQTIVQEEYNKFKAIPMPKGGEELAASMSRFFEVETNGLRNITEVLITLQNKNTDPQAFDALIRALDDFTRNENDALANFDQIQKNTAAKYKEQVETSQKVSLS